MDKIKIIALDLDGTLLNSQKILTERNRLALEKASKKGIHIVPTTGRFFDGMPEAVKRLPFIRYAITINGAEVYDRETKTAIARTDIPFDLAIKIFTFLDNYDVIYDCYLDGFGRMTAAHYNKAEQFLPDPIIVNLVHKLRLPVPDLKKYAKEIGHPIQKITSFNNNDIVREQLRSDLKATFPEILAVSSSRLNIEINIKDANKGNGIKTLAEHLGLTLKNCVVFGDASNDTTMFEMAGTRVAMGNAIPEIKALATHITKTNDEDGVADFIEKYIL